MQQSKRRFLQLCGVIVGSTSLAGCMGDDDSGDEDDASGQTPSPTSEGTPAPGPDSDGTEEDADVDVLLAVDEASASAESVVVEEFDAAVDGTLEVHWAGKLRGSVTVPAEQSLREFELSYFEELTEVQTVTVQFVPHDADEPVESFSLTVNPTLVPIETGAVQMIEPQPSAGFSFPYFVHVPEESERRESAPILVSPNNTGTRSNDLSIHINVAETRISNENRISRAVADELGVPILMPVFPRPDGHPSSELPYTHQLDRETLEITGENLERIDTQLLAMVDHFRASLEQSLDYQAPSKIHLDGFSAAGNFVNRFTALHPERVACATAGGVNGTLLLPIEEYDGQELPYHIGVSDLHELTGEDFDRDAWRETPQLLYMGGEDENDTIPFAEAWNPELRSLALDVYGEDMQDDRMPFCKEIYDGAGADAQIVVYENTGHTTPRWIMRDIYEFHERHLDTDEFRPLPNVRTGENLEIAFAETPEPGDETIAIHVDIFDYLLGLDQPFSDGSLSLMADTGPTVEWMGREFSLSGNRFFRPEDLPTVETRILELDRELKEGEQITVGIMDGNIITETTAWVGGEPANSGS